MLVDNSIWAFDHGRCGDGAGDNSYIEPEQVVYGVTEVLLAAEVALCGLNRSVAKQELNLLDLTAVRMAQLRAGPAQIVRSDVLQSSLLAASLHHISNHILRDAVAP